MGANAVRPPARMLHAQAQERVAHPRMKAAEQASHATPGGRMAAATLALATAPIADAFLRHASLIGQLLIGQPALVLSVKDLPLGRRCTYSHRTPPCVVAVLLPYSVYRSPAYDKPRLNEGVSC